MYLDVFVYSTWVTSIPRRTVYKIPVRRKEGFIVSMYFFAVAVRGEGIVKSGQKRACDATHRTTSH